MKISFTPSLVGQRQLARTTAAIQRSLQRLSTGLAVNSPADNVAISSQDVKLDAQVRGLRFGAQNANEAQSMLTAAEGAVSTQLEIVTRMRELSLQASNGTLTSSERSSINVEMNQLLQEFQRITSSTEFNGQKLLNGSIGKVGLQLGDKRESGLDQIYMDISNLDASKVFLKTVGTGSFNTRVSYNSSDYLKVESGDVNNDGKMDLVGFDRTTGGIGVYLGNGDGTLQSAKTTSTVATGINNTRLIDLNHDGVLDLAFSDYVSYRVSVMIGNGDGTFRSQTTFEGADYGEGALSTFDFGDVNDDGNLDLVTISSVGDGVLYYAGKGDGTFGPQQTFYDSGSTLSIYEMKLVDANNDGIFDLSLIDGFSGDTVFALNNQSGDFTLTSDIYMEGYTTTYADMNGDGKTDAISVDSLYLGNGDGTFQAGVSIGATGTAWRVGDLNNDGILDLADPYNSLFAFGKGDGTFNTSQALSMQSSASGMTLADLNGDGVLDIASSYATGSLATRGLGVVIANPNQTSGVLDIDVSTQTKAQALLKILDTASAGLKSEQARLGGLHERLDYVASSNLLRADSLDEARQNMMSADIALESAELVRNQILQQAQVAVLAQANLNAQVVLGLLKFNS